MGQPAGPAWGVVKLQSRMHTFPTITGNAGRVLGGVVLGLAALAGAYGASRGSRDASVHARTRPAVIVARRAMPPGCILPASPELQPYRCGGDYAGAFNQAIPAGTATDPQSAVIVAQIIASMRLARVVLDENNSVPGVWVASRSDPVWRVTSSAGLRTISFRIPPGARPAPGADGPLVVDAPDSSTYGPDTELRVYQGSMDVATHTLSTTEYGLIHYGRGSNGRPFYGYGTGYGLSWAGLIRAWEVSNGAIDHALRVAAPVDSGEHRLPAITSDCHRSSSNTCDGLIAEGLRLQLSPSVDCAARSVPFADPGGPDTRLLHEICRALQVYGMIIVDGSGSPNQYVLEMELGTEVGGTAPWSSILNPPPGDLWGNIIRDVNASATGDGVSRNASTGIPWDQLRVLSTSVFGGS